jgi:glycosyltransferase involved in cell wall biosynthesis
VTTLVAHGYDVTVAYSPRRGLESQAAAARYAASGAQVHSVSMWRSPEPCSDLVALVRLYRLMRRGRFQLVHCHSSKAGVLGRTAARLAGLPVVVYSPHGFAFEGARLGMTARIIRRIEAMCGAWTNCICCLSAHEAAQARALGIPPERIEIIPNGVRTVGGQMRTPHRTPPLRIGTAGRTVRQKGQDTLIRALACGRTRWPPLVLEVAGEGPGTRRLQRLARRLGVQVNFLGRLARIEEWLQTLDLFVLASRWEGMPLALLEAMSLGVPVVATCVGGVPEMLDRGAAGLLVPPDDIRALAAGIETALADPLRTAARASVARQRVAGANDLDRVMQSYVRLYDRLLARG